MCSPQLFSSSDTNDDDGWSAAADAYTCHPAGRRLRYPQHFPADTDDTILPRKNASASSTLRPKTSPAHARRSSVRPGYGSRSTPPRAPSAGAGGTRSGGTARWAGGDSRRKTVGSERQTPLRPCCSTKVDRSKQGMRRENGKGGRSEDKNSPRSCCCCRRIEAAWSYQAAKRPDRDSSRKILVKVPCVRTNERVRSGRGVSYRLAWSGDTADGGDEDCGDVGDKERAGTTGGNVQETAAIGFFPWGKIKKATTVVQLPRPLEREDASVNTSCTDCGSCFTLSDERQAEGSPRASRVIAHLRASVARDHRPSLDHSAPTSTPTSGQNLALSPSAWETGRNAPVRCSPTPKPRGARARARPKSAGVGNTLLSYPPRTDTRASRMGQRGAICGGWSEEKFGGGTRARNDGRAASARRSTPGASPVGSRQRRDVPARANYSFFPSAAEAVGRKERTGTERGYNDAGSLPGEALRGVGGEWKGPLCSSFDTSNRGGFEFELESPRTLRQAVGFL